MDSLSKYTGCLSHLSFRNEDSNGRRYGPECDRYDAIYYGHIDPFIQDKRKVMDCKAFRRSMYKAQVFSLPRNPHIRKRLTHGLEVTSLAGTIAEILGLNIALVEAGSIAHDIGHTPYGHLGESFLTTVLGREFRHNIFGTIVAQHIERKGVGLNLAFETLEGILFHSGGRKSISSWSDLRAEYAVIRLADKIAFTFSDLNDALRYGYLGSDRGFDAMVWNWFGSNQRERIANCVHALVQESAEENHISFSRSETAQRFEELKKWMYENVYSQVDSTIQATILERTYDFLSTGPAFEECDPAMLLALLTDDETDAIGHILLESKRLRADNGLIKNFGIMQIIPDLKGKRIDLFDPDLGWGTKP